MNMLNTEFHVSAFYVNAKEATRSDDWLARVKPAFRVSQIKKSRLVKMVPSNSFLRTLLYGGYDIYVVDGYSTVLKLWIIFRLLRNGKRVFINVDGIDIWKIERTQSGIKEIIKGQVYKSGARFLCGSRIAADRIIDCGADKEKVFVHPFTSLHEADIITFEEKVERQKEFKNKIGAGDKKVVVAVGRFIQLKRYDVLIQAWKDMPSDCVLYLIGGGELRSDYERLIRELSVKNITILDYMNKDELNEYYMAADLFVHTSETEVWGLVFNEAMAKGCPVISTNHCVGGVELIRDGIEGYIVEVGSVEELRSRMVSVLDNGHTRKKMIQKSIERIRAYTYENLSSIHFRVFQESVKYG